MAAYMRDQFPFFGIPNPPRVAVTRQIEDALGPLGEADLVDLARQAWTLDEREHQYAACWFVARRSEVLTPDFLPTAQVLISTKPWWDTVDELAKHVVGPIVRAHPDRRALMDEWLVGDDLWLARTAILHQERWKDDTDPDWLFAACLTPGRRHRVLHPQGDRVGAPLVQLRRSRCRRGVRGRAPRRAVGPVAPRGAQGHRAVPPVVIPLSAWPQFAPAWPPMEPVGR